MNETKNNPEKRNYDETQSKESQDSPLKDDRSTVQNKVDPKPADFSQSKSDEDNSDENIKTQNDTRSSYESSESTEGIRNDAEAELNAKRENFESSLDAKNPPELKQSSDDQHKAAPGPESATIRRNLDHDRSGSEAEGPGIDAGLAKPKVADKSVQKKDDPVIGEDDTPDKQGPEPTPKANSPAPKDSDQS